jgi:hypothetical protein
MFIFFRIINMDEFGWKKNFAWQNSEVVFWNLLMLVIFVSSYVVLETCVRRVVRFFFFFDSNIARLKITSGLREVFCVAKNLGEKRILLGKIAEGGRFEPFKPC